MNYSTQQIDEIRTIIIDLKFKKEELEDLEMDAYDLLILTKIYILYYFIIHQKNVSSKYLN